MNKHALFILGAGDGGRLGKGIPKPLVQIACHRILDMQLAMFRPDDWYVVAGYKAHLYTPVTNRVINNPCWEDGIMTSYKAIYDASKGYEYLTCVDGDLVFSRKSAIKLMNPEENVLLVGNSCTEAIGLNSYGVRVQDGIISADPAGCIWGCAITLTRQRLKKLIDKEGHLDLFIHRLWEETGFRSVIENELYIEIDTMEDLEAAQNVFN